MLIQNRNGGGEVLMNTQQRHLSSNDQKLAQLEIANNKVIGGIGADPTTTTSKINVMSNYSNIGIL